MNDGKFRSTCPVGSVINFAGEVQLDFDFRSPSQQSMGQVCFFGGLGVGWGFWGQFFFFGGGSFSETHGQKTKKVSTFMEFHVENLIETPKKTAKVRMNTCFFLHGT